MVWGLLLLVGTLVLSQMEAYCECVVVALLLVQSPLLGPKKEARLFPSKVEEH